MSTATSAIQTAIYTRLTGDATLMGLVTGVFDAVPQEQTLPYVTIGQFEGEDWSTFAKLGEAYAVNLHVWNDSAKGQKTVQAIQSRVDTLLNRAALTVTGYVAVSCIREYVTVLQDPDGVTWHGVQRFRIHVNE